jgi:bacteriocin-like protein
MTEEKKVLDKKELDEKQLDEVSGGRGWTKPADIPNQPDINDTINPDGPVRYA